VRPNDFTTNRQRNSKWLYDISALLSCSVPQQFRRAHRNTPPITSSKAALGHVIEELPGLDLNDERPPCWRVSHPGFDLPTNAIRPVGKRIEQHVLGHAEHRRAASDPEVA